MPDDEKRFVLLNKIVVFFLFIGIPASISLYFIDGVPRELAHYIAILAINYFFLLYLNHKKQFTITGLYIVLAGDLATGSAPILLGLESQAQFLLLIIAGLPYLIFKRSWGFRRFLLSAFVVPIWFGVHYYCHRYPPVFELEPEVLELVGHVYGMIILVWATYIFYHFTVQTERYGDQIREQRDSLNDKNKRLERFNYMATHDLKTPVANIEGFHSLLEMDLENPSKDVVDSMKGIKMSVDRAKTIIHDLIEVTRHSNIREEVQVIDLKSTMNNITESMSVLIDETKTKLKVDFSRYPKVVFGSVAMHSILQNLVSNAIKYRSPDRAPLIEVSSSQEGQFAVLKVKDNGLGIDLKKEKGALFGMFQRVHTKAEGSGVGLYMIKNLVEEKGGAIDVESEVGKGTTFSVRIPQTIAPKN